jgi:O-antigen/teichoic acid export membrane protein
MSVTSEQTRNLTGGRLLARNTLWSLFGQATPMVAALVAIPVLIGRLGTERFGLLNLSWMVIGYFGLFDLGLGRALTKVIAERIGTKRGHEVPTLFWTTLALLFGLSCLAAAIVAGLTHWLVWRVLDVTPALRPETQVVFYLLAISIPADMLVTALRGTLEACQRFDLTGSMLLATGLFTFLAPLLMLPFSDHLPAIVVVLLCGRVLSLAIHFVMCLRALPALRTGFNIDRHVVKSLLRLGGWMTVSNSVYPLMMTLDRLFIGSLVSVAAVAYYGTAYEAVTQLWIIPTAITGVLFPAFSASFGQDRLLTVRLFTRGVKSLFIILTPVVLCAIVIASEAFRLWLGAEVASHTVRVFQLLAVGVLITGLSNIPFALLQAGGRPDLTARLHLAELPLYVLAVWYMAGHYGIEGVAIVWIVRGIFDTAALFVLAKSFLAVETGGISPIIARAIPAGLIVAAALAIPDDRLVKAVFLPLACLVFGIGAWRWGFSAEERERARAHVDGIPGWIRRRAWAQALPPH